MNHKYDKASRYEDFIILKLYAYKPKYAGSVAVVINSALLLTEKDI